MNSPPRAIEPLSAPESATDEQAFIDEARASGYTGKILVAVDLMQFDIDNR